MTDSPTTLAFRALPADIQSTCLSSVSKGPLSYVETLLLVGRAIEAERERCAVIGKEAAMYSGCPADFIADEIADAIRRGVE